MALPRAIVVGLLGLLWGSADAADTPTKAIQQALNLSAEPAKTPYVFVERKGAKVRGVVAEIVPHDVRHVMRDVILCYGEFPRWFPLQTKARYVSQKIEDNSAVIYGQLSFPWPIGSRDFEADIVGTYTLDATPPRFRVDFDHRPGTGNIKHMTGHWLVEPYGPDKTLVVYDSTADFDTWVPGFLLARGTQQFLPGIMDRMKKRTDKCTSGAPPGGLPDIDV